MTAEHERNVAGVMPGAGAAPGADLPPGTAAVPGTAAAPPGTDHVVTSVDGRTFACRVPLEPGYLAGDLALVECTGGRRLLGQVLDVALVRGAVACTGRILAEVADGAVRETTPRPFAGGRMTRAPREALDAFDSWSRHDLEVGTVRAGSDVVPALVRTGGFNRHTFVCGQSGSGKTYALGVVLERLLAHTALNMIIFDPNADFVHLGEVLPEESDDTATRLRQARVRVLRSGRAALEPEARPLTVAFPELSPADRAAVLGVDPLADREEFNALRGLFSTSLGGAELQEFARRLATGDRPIDRALAQRFENLGLLEMSVWSRTESASCLAESKLGSRALVLDLAGFDDPRERSIAALALLQNIWAERERRAPVLLVIDEAHNLCSSEPSDPLQAAVTARLAQIAAEGRKYGLWLLLSTQRPSKIHPNVLSQCDNLLLMRMNSPGDLAELGAVFGFVPPRLLATVPEFRRGECLVAGAYSAVPRVVQVGRRLTREGGGDVAVPRTTYVWTPDGPVAQEPDDAAP